LSSGLKVGEPFATKINVSPRWLRTSGLNTLEVIAVSASGTTSVPYRIELSVFEKRAARPLDDDITPVMFTEPRDGDQFYLAGKRGNDVVSITYGGGTISMLFSTILSWGSYVHKITTIGRVAILAFEVTNSGFLPQVYTFGLHTDLDVDTRDRAATFSLPDLGGFYVQGNQSRLYCFCDHHPLVVPTDVYQFGSDAYGLPFTQSYGNTDANNDAKLGLAWVDHSLAPGEKEALCVVLRWGDGSNPPVLALTGSLSRVISPNTPLSLSGSVSDPDGGSVSVYAIADGRATTVYAVATVASGESFSRGLTLLELGLAPGSHQVSVHAIDESGTFAVDPVVLSVTVNAPAATMTLTVPATQTPTPSASVKQRTAVMKYTVADDRFNLKGEAEGSSVSITSGDGGFVLVPNPTTLPLPKIKVVTVGPVAIACLQVSNFEATDRLYSLGIKADLNIGAREGPDCYNTWPNFYAEGDDYAVFFISANHPLVIDGDAYWFGSYYDMNGDFQTQVELPEYHSSDSAMGLSWRNRIIPRGGTDTISFVVRWGVGSAPPVLTISLSASTVAIGESITFSGSIADPDGGWAAVYCAMDHDPFTLAPIVTEQAVGTSFTQTVSVADLGLTVGSRILELYAIDSTGTISVTPVAFSITVQGAEATIPLSRTPRESVSVSETPTESRAKTASPFPTRTPTRTRSQYYLSAVMESSVTGAKYFTINGRSESGDRVGITNGQFELIFQSASLRRPTAQITTVGAAAIVAVEIANPTSAVARFSIGVNGDLEVDGDALAPCTDLGNGFVADGEHRQLFFICRDSPMVIDTDVYVFGPGVSGPSLFPWDTVESDPDGWARVGLSWINREIAAYGSTCVSVVLRWGAGSAPPVLTVQLSQSQSVSLADSVTFTGSVSDPNGDTIAVYAAVHSNFANLVEVSALASARSFTKTFTVAELGVTLGDPTVSFYAIDATGTFSVEPLTVTIPLVAPTATPLPTPTKSNTPYPSLTPTARPTVTRTPTASRSPRPSRSPVPSATIPASETDGQSPTISLTPRASVVPATPSRSPFDGTRPRADSGGLSSGEKVAIGVVVPVAVIAIAVGLVLFLRSRSAGGDDSSEDEKERLRTSV
jgi:hypothetical protein